VARTSERRAAINPAGDDVRRGVGLALAAAALFVTMDSCVKLLTARYPILQIVAINAFLAAVLTGSVARWHKGPSALRSRRPWMQLLRGLGLLVIACLGFYAYAHLPLAEAYAILFSMPLIITGLAGPLLGERVGWQRWTAVVVGFAGVLVILWPGPEGIQLAALAALGNAVLASFTLIVMRVMREETPESFVVYGNGTVAAGAAFVLPFVWTTPSLPDLALFLAAGAAASLASLCIAKAYQSAPASVVAPFQYTQLLYALVIGVVLFGNVPDARMLAGAARVIGCGLYILRQGASGNAQK
jgi:drug/metabolite transporter (DMT)-like permease